MCDSSKFDVAKLWYTQNRIHGMFVYAYSTSIPRSHAHKHTEKRCYHNDNNSNFFFLSSLGHRTWCTIFKQLPMRPANNVQSWQRWNGSKTIWNAKKNEIKVHLALTHRAGERESVWQNERIPKICWTLLEIATKRLLMYYVYECFGRMRKNRSNTIHWKYLLLSLSMRRLHAYCPCSQTQRTQKKKQN